MSNASKQGTSTAQGDDKSASNCNLLENVGDDAVSVARRLTSLNDFARYDTLSQPVGV